MKSLRQIEADKRVSEIERLSPDESELKYFVWLNDGYVFEDGSHMFGAESVAEINELMSYIKPEV